MSATAIALSAVLVASCSSDDGGGGGGGGGASAPGVTESEIVIGTTNPLTGVVAAACKPVSDGALAWFDHVNAEGGVNGREINNIVLDDVYRAPDALANARELVAEPVLAMFGGCGTIQPPAILQVITPEKVPYLFPYAGLPELTEAPNVALLLPLYQTQLVNLVDKVIEDNGPGSFYVIEQRVPGSDATTAAVQEAVEAAGGTWAGATVTTAGASDYTPAVLEANAAEPDYIILSQAAPDAARIVDAMSRQNAFPNKLILGQSTLATGAFVNPAGQAASGRVLTVSPVVPSTSESAQSCIDAFEEQGAGLEPDGFSLFGCATAQVLTTALEEMGDEVTREGLIETLQGWEGKEASELFPPLTFTEEDNVGNDSMILVGIENGQLVEQGTVDVNVD
jgi:ABC-type branched-subunit amino acid transport system substrate-binding protein